ncbi:hypothetical protein ACFL6E_02930 [Candidatus Neomarinimicrobiota bacterium]
MGDFGAWFGAYDRAAGDWNYQLLQALITNYSAALKRWIDHRRIYLNGHGIKEYFRCKRFTQENPTPDVFP